LPEFLKGFGRAITVYVTVGMTAEGSGRQNIWAVVHVQEDRRMIQSHHELNDLSYDQTLLRWISAAVGWTPISDRSANRRMDQSVIIYSERLRESTQSLRNPNVRIMKEIVEFTETSKL
jgi:hypothetical protein